MTFIRYALTGDSRDKAASGFTSAAAASIVPRPALWGKQKLEIDVEAEGDLVNALPVESHKLPSSI